MAKYAMIDGYLDTMRTEIRWRRDLDDVVVEMEDHLYSTVEGMLATGLEPEAAQRETLERFGEPKLLAALYASSNSGGIAVPTRTTIRAGTLALAAAALWLVAVAVNWFDTVRDSGGDDSDWYVWYIVWTALVGAAGVLGVFVMIALGKRHGGFGAAGLIALVITSLGVLFSIGVAWASPAWMAVIGIGYLITGIKVWIGGLAPKASTALFSMGMLLGVGAFIVADALKIGTPDSYGDYPVSWIVGHAVGFGLTALGLIGLGLWLKNEQPADVMSDTPITA
jgi:hypothetical protein